MNYLAVSRVAFNIFGVDVYYYGIFITLGIIIAFLMCFLLCKRKGLSNNVPYELLIAIVPIGILCARLFDVLFDNSLTIADYFKFREGGMSIIGAVIGGAIGLGILSFIKKKNYFEYSDIVCTVLILAQAIGRWGNFFNGELYGREILDPALQHFPIAVEIGGSYYQALFFYESMLNLIGFAVLFCIYWFTKQKGLATGSYLVYYGTIRTILEPMRQTEYILYIPNTTIQISRVMSITMIVVGALFLACLIIKTIINKGKVKTSERR